MLAPPIDLDAHVESWVKPESVDAREILNATAEATGRTRFGYTRADVWLRLRLQNGDVHAQDWVLRLAPPLIERVELSEWDEKGTMIHAAAFDLEHRTELGAMSRRAPSFLLSLPAHSLTTLVLRLRSSHSLDTHLRLTNPNLESLRNNREQFVLGAYYGIFFIIFALNLYLFFGTWDLTYLCYVGFLLALGMQLSTLNGVLDFHFDGSFSYSRYLGGMSGLSLAFGNFFAMRFLQTRTRAPLLNRVHLGLAALGLALAAVNFSPWFPVVSVPFGHVVDAGIAASALMIFVSTVVMLRRGYHPAIFFLIAWGAFLGMIGIYFFATYGLIHSSFFTVYAVQIGSSVELVLLSIGLAYRVHLLRLAKIAAEEKARETDKLRSLIHVICHDLRNPLGVISTYAQFKVRRGDSEWATIVRAAQSQKDILDYVEKKEAIESGKYKLKLIPVQIGETLENVRFIFDERMRTKGVELHCQIPEGLAVLADPTLFTHTVVANLVSNAIKFTPAGGRIEIQAIPNGTSVRLEVRDSGIGIPSELLRNLFSQSVPTTRPGTDGEKGTGFGMPLVKTVMSSFGGAIRVESATRDDSAGPSGTRVILTLKKA